MMKPVLETDKVIEIAKAYFSDDMAVVACVSAIAAALNAASCTPPEALEAENAKLRERLSKAWQSFDNESARTGCKKCNYPHCFCNAAESTPTEKP